MNAQSPTVALRAALYLRVSTPRQAEHDVSIPDQRKQGDPILGLQTSFGGGKTHTMLALYHRACGRL